MMMIIMDLIKKREKKVLTATDLFEVLKTLFTLKRVNATFWCLLYSLELTQKLSINPMISTA